MAGMRGPHYVVTYAFNSDNAPFLVTRELDYDDFLDSKTEYGPAHGKTLGWLTEEQYLKDENNGWRTAPQKQAR